MRRLVGELMEHKLEPVVRTLAALREELGKLPGNAGRALADQADQALRALGAVRFEAQRLDHVDPLIHTVGREEREAQLPDGVILATLRPGYRTGRGAIVARALVAVNRRS